MPKLSIIIPVYNVEKYLRECLDSVVNQTLKDIEIICIDDCSTDSSLEILKEYASKDNRFILLEQEFNQGQGVARNEGIKIATGEYIGFVDPDDWIDLDMYESMYSKAKEFDTDIVICNIEKYYNNSNFVEHINTLKSISELDKNITSNITYNFKHLYKDFLKLTNNYAGCRIYKRKLISDYKIRFAPIRTGEDKLFCCMAKILAERIIHINKEFYHYRIHRKNQFIKNEFMNIMCVSLMNEIYKYNPDDNLKIGVVNYLKHLCMRQYKGLNINDKKYLYDNCKNYLPYNSFIKFRKEVFIYNLKEIMRMILSTKNIVENGAIYKYLFLFGFKIKLKEKTTQTLVQ